MALSQALANAGMKVDICWLSFLQCNQHRYRHQQYRKETTLPRDADDSVDESLTLMIPHSRHNERAITGVKEDGWLPLLL